jgi:hypothetical protein
MRIPGLPGASDPTFRTRDALLLSLDRIVHDVCTELAVGGLVISLPVAKAAIQAARHGICRQPSLVEAEIVVIVGARLRRERILLPPSMIRRLLRCYLRTVIALDITEVDDPQVG